MAAHTVDILNAEACCKDSNLDLLVEFRVNGQSPFQLEVGTEVIHELCHIAHLLHGQTGVILVVTVEVDGEQDFLRFVDIVVVEQRRVECVFNRLLDTALSFAVAG